MSRAFAVCIRILSLGYDAVARTRLTQWSTLHIGDTSATPPLLVVWTPRDSDVDSRTEQMDVSVQNTIDPYYLVRRHSTSKNTSIIHLQFRP